MPIGFVQQPQVDLDRLDAGAASLPVPQSAGLGAAFEASHQFGNEALQFGKHLVLDTLGMDPADPVSQEHPFGDTDQRLPAETANHRFGIDGALRFNAPVTADDAAWQSVMKRRQLLDANLLARSNPNPLMSFGAGLAGSLSDPAGLSVMLATGGLGDVAVGALCLRGLEEAGAAGAAITRLGRLANVGRGVAAPLVSGAVDNTPYVVASGLLSRASGDEYGFGDGLRDIAAGAILHTTVHAAMRTASSVLGRFRSADGDPARSAPPTAFTPDPTPAGGVPDAVNALPPVARQGAFALALDRMANDEPVDVGHLVDRELNPPGLERLNEQGAEPQVSSWRPLEGDVAVTTRGTEVPVRYGLVELGELVTSHDDNLGVNPAYPSELQPRARERAGAQARNYQLEQELNPRLLMGDVGAGSGAPIVAPDGVVESGNGRTIALRRSAAKGGEAYARYRAALDAAGHDTTGMKAPVLARMREQPMQGGARAALAREMNADVTERMGAAEQAQVDAARISDGSFEALPDNAAPWGARDFARDFIARAAPDQANVLAGADGSLSPEGVRRIKAAVLQRAYGDARLVGQIFEDEASDVRKLGEAAAEAAPMWARMRAAASLGSIPRALDLTANLTGAMDLVRFAKAEGKPLGEVVGELLGQSDMFSGSALSPATEAMLRLMYRDAEFKKPTAAPKLASALRDYARQALEVKPGKDLFGETPSEDTARQILANLSDRFAAGDAGPIDIVRPPGPSRGEPGARPAVVDLRAPGAERDGRGPGLSSDGGRAPEGAGGGDGLKAGASPGRFDRHPSYGTAAHWNEFARSNTNIGTPARYEMLYGVKPPKGAATEKLLPEPKPAEAAAAKPERVTGQQLIAADPELRELLAETERLEQANGVTAEIPDTENPDTLAEAIRAAAVCLSEEM